MRAVRVRYRRNYGRLISHDEAVVYWRLRSLCMARSHVCMYDSCEPKLF